jgi:hypothetical protein
MVDPQIVVLDEEETSVGLRFRARVEVGASSRMLEVRLHWADYNLWSPDGTDPPERVATAVLRFVCSRCPLAELPPSFDAASLRRRHSDADREVPALVRRAP